MIGRLTGRLVECSPGEVLLDVAGVGYSLQITLNTYYALSDRPTATPVSLEVHTHVREDALQLFGFHHRTEKQDFERLIRIAGVGPRLALSILSGIDGAALRLAVERGDRARLQKIPGVGRKTAERLLLELRDKLDGEPRPGGRRRVAGAGPMQAPSAAESLREDALSALVNIGYTQDVAARAVDGALDGLDPDPDLQTVLRAALGGLAR